MLASEWPRRFPWTLLVCAVLLMGVGLIGIARSEELVAGSGRYLRQQVLWAALTLAVMLASAAVSYRRVGRWSYPIFLAVLALLLLVYFFPPVNGARRWIRMGPIGVQPSELAKAALVLVLARYLMHQDSHRRLRGLVMPLALTLLPMGLILKEPDLGTALLFPPTLLVMLFVAGARRGHLAGLALAGVLLAPLLWMAMSREQQSRITALFEQAGPADPPQADTYQLRQAKQVLLLGNVWGSAISGQAVEDLGAYHLPEARSDFILSMLGERLGLPGIALLLSLYGVLVYQGASIAAAAQEPFGRLLAAGLTAVVAVQATINLGMAVGLLPVTGVSLPLVSYGGSGLVSFGLVLGLLMNVALRPGFEASAESFRFVEGEG